MVYGLLHGDITVSGSIPHKSIQLPIDKGFGINIDGAVNLAAHAQILVVLAMHNTGFALLQRLPDFILVISEATDNPIPGNDNSFHLMSTI